MLVTIRDLELGYGSRTLVSGLNLDVARGERVALQGPSGSGKTTLLSAIAGMTPPRSGTVTLQDSAHDRTEWAMQSSPMMVRRTAHDNVSLAARIRGTDDATADAQTQHLLDMLGLAPRSSAPLHKLSGGERQRVALARAVVTDPVLVLADEPTASLDRETIDRVMLLIARTADAGTAFLIATHDDDVAGRCDRVVTLRSVGAGAASEEK